MKIVVCIKQVPDVDDIKWTKENNLDRAQMLSKLNLYDLWALNWAKKIKEKFNNVEIVALSMGPNQANEVLRLALAKCATRAILLSDKAFSASDTLITARILARAIKKYVPDFDMILTGQMAQDGDTAQVPVSLAQELDIADIENVFEIINADKSCALVHQRLQNETNVIEVKTPCLLAVKKDVEEENLKQNPKIEDYVRAQNVVIETYNAQDLDFKKEEVGILGSPTMVQKAYRPKSERNAQKIDERITFELFSLIKEAKGI